MAAAHAPGIGPLIEHLRQQGGRPEATVLVHGDRLPVSAAALANAAMVHAWDLDDVLSDGCTPVHVTSVIVPTVLACGERAGAPGRKAIASMIAGIEVVGRLAAVCRGRTRGAGFLLTSILGGFGAVVTAGRLLGLDEQQMAHAMGIQYAQAAGNRQALLDHTLTKRLQPGFAARSAIESVQLAKRGITGPRDLFEGEAGLFKVYMNGDVPDAQEITANNGPLYVERVSMKRYPSCGACHHVQMAAERLVAEHDVKPDEIDRVELVNCDPAGIVTGPFVPGAHPSVAAQFSAEWAVAHTLLRGPATLGDYTDAAVAADTGVINLANTITNGPVPGDVELPEPGAQGVIAHTTDGRRLIEMQPKSRTFPPGGMTWGQAVAKFDQCAAFGLGDACENAANVVAQVERFDRADRVEPLMAAICHNETESR